MKILGKTVLQMMRENLGATVCDEPPAGDKTVLFPVFPFLQKSELGLLEATDDTPSACGYIECGGIKTALRIKGRGAIFSLADYADALKLANDMRRKALGGIGVLVYEGAEVDYDAVLEEGVVVESGAHILGKSVIGKNAVIGSGSKIVNAKIGENSRVENSVITDSEIGKDCTVGPFAYLRPHSTVGDGCRIGDFVEIKNAQIGTGSKASHLAYIGDAEVGDRVNIGCGVVFVNYNGKTKSKTQVGDGSFIGSNCNLIAPVSVGAGVFLAAGTTLTCDLADGDFCIGRNRETVKSGRASRYLTPKP